MNRRMVWGMAAILLIAAAVWPVTTRFGIDYEWSSKQITLFEKVLHFISRDLQARRLASEITEGARDGQEKLLKIFTWTVRHVQPTPPGFPVVDDHVMHIIIRGYGAPDQRTEAFALLASYSGFPSTAAYLTAPGTEQRIIVAVVRDGARTYLFDVERQMVFKNRLGQFADLRELIADPSLVDTAAHGLTVAGVPYGQYLLSAGDLQASFARMEAQKPWPRLAQEVQHALGRSQ
jgi:hypothetical protein